MKIGHIATEYKPITGGAQTYLANLHEIFSQKGYEQSVYQFDDGVRDPELRLLPHKPPFLKGGRALDLWWFNLVLNSKLAELRAEDVLICHYAFHSLPLWWKRKVIVLSHGCEWDIPPTSLSQRLKIKIAQWSFRHFKYLVANDTNYFRQMGVAIQPQEKMFEEIRPGKWFIPNCVDTDYFRPVEPAPGFPEQMILVPRNLSRPRGIHLAIDGFALFNKTFPETNLVLVGGCFDEEYKKELEDLIHRKNLGAKVCFKGSIAWKKIRHVYCAADLVVIPTLQREGTSLAALEAMSCGLATVSTNVHGLADLPTVQSEPTAADLARAMQTTYVNREKIGREQRQRVREVYNLENWKKAWLSVICGL